VLSAHWKHLPIFIFPKIKRQHGFLSSVLMEVKNWIKRHYPLPTLISMFARRKPCGSHGFLAYLFLSNVIYPVSEWLITLWNVGRPIS
jgi:hypothetical protein